MYNSTHFFTTELDGGEWSFSRLCHVILGERAPAIHWIGGWVGPRAGLDAEVKRIVPSRCRNSNPRSSSPQYWAILAPNCTLLYARTNVWHL